MEFLNCFRNPNLASLSQETTNPSNRLRGRVIDVLWPAYDFVKQEYLSVGGLPYIVKNPNYVYVLASAQHLAYVSTCISQSEL